MTKRALSRGVDAYFEKCDASAFSPMCLSCKEGAGDKCAKCQKRRAPYTVSGLCLHLGISKRDIISMKKDERLHPVIEAALRRIEKYVEESALLGVMNATFAQAVLKENFGWGKEDAPDAVRIELCEEAESYGG